MSYSLHVYRCGAWLPIREVGVLIQITRQFPSIEVATEVKRSLESEGERVQIRDAKGNLISETRTQ